jgi:hypothetical protein
VECLTLAALLMIAYRFANLSLAPFISDEPAFLSAAREQIRSGHWLAVSPLVGKQGLHYGPTVLWFYGIIHLSFGADAAVHIFAMLTCMVAAHLALAYGIRKRFGPLAGATSLAFLASSPYQFLWSRLAWDQSVDICAAWILFALCTFDRITRRVWVGVFLGIVIGLAISSHLMVLPLVFLVFMFLAFEALWRHEWKSLLASVAVVLTVNIPYLGYLSHHYQEASPAQPLSWDLVQKYALEPARVATLTGLDYFFDDAWPNFLAEEHWAGSPWMSPNAKTAVAAVAALGLLWTAWRGRAARRRVALLGLAAWVGYAFFFGQRRVGDPPHYQFATWWIIPLGLAAGVSSLEKRWRWVSLGAAGAVWTLSIAQMRFIFDWMAYVRRHGGTQGVHYGAPLAEQKSAIRAACSDDHDRILVFNDTHIFDRSLRYVASTESRCAGKTLSFCGSDDCTRAAGAARVRIAYARPGSGWLFIKFAE